MIPLVVRSYYSLMWGVSAPEKICERAASLGYKRLALTDTDNLYGLWRFLEACERHHIRPIVGAELTDPASHDRAVCLVKTDTGRTIQKFSLNEVLNSGVSNYVDTSQYLGRGGLYEW